jgi:hypothetical protein
VPGDELAPPVPERHGSPDIHRVTEVVVTCQPHEGEQFLTIGLTSAGEIDAYTMDDPGRLVIDIR